jgi:hypothetical protein
MNEIHEPGYYPILLSDWRERLASLIRYVEQAEPARPEPPAPGFDPAARIALIADYITDMKTCLAKANARIAHLESCINSLNRLVDRMDQDRAGDRDKILRNAPLIPPKPIIDETRGNGGGPRLAVLQNVPGSKKTGRHASNCAGSKKHTANPVNPARLYSIAPSRGF